MEYLSRARVTIGHTSRRYFSRYLGNRVAKLEASRREPPGRLSPFSGAHLSTSQWFTVSLSHGLSLLYLLWFFLVVVTFPLPLPLPLLASSSDMLVR